MITVVITVIIMLILLSVFIGSSTSSIDQASETKIKQEMSEIKKGIDSIRLLNAKEGTDEETLNKGFIKVRIENAPESFVSFDDNEVTGYVVDLSTISYEKLKTGRDYLTLMKGDIVTFDKDDVFAYDGVGKVYYLKGYQLETGELSYTEKAEERKEGPIVEILSTELGNVELKVTPKYGGEITSVIVGSKTATSMDGTNFEVKLTSNGSYIVIATEEGGNSTRTTLSVADITEEQSARPEIIDVYVNDHSLYANKTVATLVIEAEDASKMSISQEVLDVPSVNDIARWREYKKESSIMLKEGINKIYVWVKSENEVSSDYKLAEVILDSIVPTRDEPTYIMDGYKLVITCNQADESEMTIEYGYKKTTEAEYTWQDSQIVLDVEPGVAYNIITRAIDIAGNASESRPIETAEVLSIPDNITIEASPEEMWTQRVAVSISYPGTYGIEPYENLYRINGGEWQKASSNSVAMTVISNAKIEAAVSAKLNGTDTRFGNIKEYDVKNIDRVKPYIFDVPEAGQIVQEGFDITFKIIDEESGLVAWNVTDTNEIPDEWAETFEPTLDVVEGTHKVEKSGTYYIWGKDESGQIGSLEIKIENIDVTDPVIDAYQVNYGTGKATIVAKATDTTLGIVAYAFTKGQGATPSDSDWIQIDRTVIPYTMTKEVTESDYYAIWVKDVSGRISHMEKYIKLIYSVTYNYEANGGETISLNGENKLYVGCNSNVDLTPTSTRVDSSFLGWHTDLNAKEGLDTLKIGDESTGQEDITLYAIFKYEDEITFTKSSDATVFELTLTMAKEAPFTTLQYSYNGTTWTDYTEGLYMTNNKTVYARTIYLNQVVTTDSITITNICENHNYKLATCLTESTCYYCGMYNGPALGHSPGTWYDDVPATCTTEGVSRSDCSRGCGYYETETIPATGHAYSEYVATKAATCLATGVESSTCANCGDIQSRAIDALGHNMGEWYTDKAAKCTETGTSRSDCSRCSYYESEEIPALGHSYDEWEEKDKQEHQRICTTCLTYEYEAHTFTTIEQEKVCSICGYIGEDVYVTLYTDGTLGFSNDDDTISGKTVQAVYGNIAESRYISTTQVPWNSEKGSIKTVTFVNKVAPAVSTARWFSSCENLTTINNIGNLDIGNVTDMTMMFYYCKGLTSLDLSSWNAGNVTDMSMMFYYCSGLTGLDLGGWNTQNVTNINYIFSGCSSLENIDISGWDTKKITDMRQLFHQCSSLVSLNLSSWNTQNVNDMSLMFSECSSLTSLDLSGWNTQNVNKMGQMFYMCTSLTSLNLSDFDTRNVTDMNSLFSFCENLNSITFGSNFNTKNVTNMSTMFQECKNLTSLNLSGFNTEKVTDMTNMFYGCGSLTSLDVSGFDTKNVTDMLQMFAGCTGVTSLDLKLFDTKNVTDMDYMFYNMTNLETIYVSNLWSTASVMSSSYMFSLTPKLVGGDGSSYATYGTRDVSFAHVDGGASNPGYFTDSRAKIEPNFTDNTWDSIIYACENNKVPSTWAVGDTKPMTINGTAYDIMIIGKNKDTYSDGSGTAPLTFQFVNCYNTMSSMHSSSASPGWSGSTMRTSTLPGILAGMPNEVKEAIREVDKVSIAGIAKNSTSPTQKETTADKLFLLSEYEVFNTTNTSGGVAEGIQYDYYANGGTKIKTFNGEADYWWLRTHLYNYEDSIAAVSLSGNRRSANATNPSIGIAPAFCF